MEALAILVVGSAILAGVAHFARKQQARWSAECARFGDVEDTSAFMVSTMRTRAPLRAASIKAVGGSGDEKNPEMWLAVSSSRVGARTTLWLTKEGLAGALRERAGLKDVHTGDADFDAAFTVRGSEPDVVRGVLGAAELRAAVTALFRAHRAGSIVVEATGKVTATFGRGDTAAASARTCLLAFVALLDLLDGRADAPPRADVAGVGSVGGGSGAPVRIPST